MEPKSRETRWYEAGNEVEAACDPLREALNRLRSIQEEYQGWKHLLSPVHENTPTGRKLLALCALDITSAIESLDSIADLGRQADPPLGYGND